MVGVDADRVVTVRGSRVLGDDFSDPKQGQFFKEARKPKIAITLNIARLKYNLYRK